MCGIIAVISLQGNPIPQDLTTRMGDLIRHRGPDDEGYANFYRLQGEWSAEIFGGKDTPQEIYTTPLPYCPHEKATQSSLSATAEVAFCHRRLSIIDLSAAGHQPMCYKGRYWIIYNGEIYNYREIKAELETLGHRFLSQSDTEVILASYDEWGEQCLDRFNGMWSFLIFDQETGVIFGSRDRYGIKPLYYWCTQNGFLAFASEIKAFTAVPGWAPTLNVPIAYDFLIHSLQEHTDETFFAGVKKIQGGEAFRLDLTTEPRQLQVYRWYNSPKTIIKTDLDESAAQLRTRLFNAVEIHLRSDVPTGSCLSGGLDSSSIVCIIKDILSRSGTYTRQETFSAYSYDKTVDEQEFIEEVNKAVGISGHHVYPEVDTLIQDIKKIIWHQDEPFGSTSIFAQWCVFNLARENNIKVILDGQGADEILAGYHHFLSIYHMSLLRQGKFHQFFHEVICAKNLYDIPPLMQVRDIIYYLLLTNPSGRSIVEIKMRGKLHPSWLNSAIKGKTPLPYPSHYSAFPDYVTAFSNFFTYQTVLPALLHYEDRNSMAHSIESRVPFLDVRLVEYLLSTPPHMKIKDGWTKCILRKAMKGILPEKIRLRKDKIGFATSEERWMRTERPEQFRALLQESISCSEGIITDDALLYYDKMKEGKIEFDFTHWRIIVFGLWMDVFGIKVAGESD